MKSIFKYVSLILLAVITFSCVDEMGEVTREGAVELHIQTPEKVNGDTRDYSVRVRLYREYTGETVVADLDVDAFSEDSMTVITEEYTLTYGNWELQRANLVDGDEPVYVAVNSDDERAADLDANSLLPISANVFQGETTTFALQVAPFAVGDEIEEPAIVGSGTKEDPYTVEDAQQEAIQNSDSAWVRGYVVGFVVYDADGNHTITTDWNSASDSNIAIASSADETDMANMLLVQLTGFDSAARTQLGLNSTQGAILGADVELYGAPEAYFSAAGLRGIERAEQFEILSDNGNGAGEVSGTGTVDDPYSVAAARQESVQTGDAAWVQGYVIGYLVYNAGGDPSLTTDWNSASDTNIAIAASADETDQSQMLYIQLSGSGSDARTQLGLNSTQGAIVGSQVKLNGNLQAYFSAPGLRGVQNADQFEILSGAEPVEAADYLAYDFEDGTDYENVALNGWQQFFQGEVTDRTFAYRSYSDNRYAQITAYSSEGALTGTVDTWLVSPALSLDEATDKVVSFETSNAYANGASFAAYIMDAPNPAQATVLTELSSAVIADDQLANYEFVASGDIDLSSYSGVVYIGFRYLAEVGQTTTFQLDNFVFGEAAEGNNETPSAAEGTQENPYSVATAIATQDGSAAYVQGYIVGFVTSGPNVTSDPANFSGDTNLAIAASADETDLANMILVQLQNDARTDLGLSSNPDNLGREVILTGSLSAYFGAPGLRGVTTGSYSFVE